MAKLFVTLAVLCVFGAVLVKGFDKKEAVAAFMATMEECKGEVGAKDADIDELVGKKPASTMEGKCLRSCIMKKFKMMNNNGKLDKDVALSFAEKYVEGDADQMKIGVEIVNTCNVPDVPADHCEAAENYLKCFKDESIAHGLKNKFEF